MQKIKYSKYAQLICYSLFFILMLIITDVNANDEQIYIGGSGDIETYYSDRPADLQLDAFDIPYLAISIEEPSVAVGGGAGCALGFYKNEFGDCIIIPDPEEIYIPSDELYIIILNEKLFYNLIAITDYILGEDNPLSGYLLIGKELSELAIKKIVVRLTQLYDWIEDIGRGISSTYPGIGVIIFISLVYLALILLGLINLGIKEEIKNMQEKR